MTNFPLKSDIFGHIYHSTLLKFIKIMSIKINYSNKSPGTTSSNIVLFSDEKYNTSNLKNIFNH